jgi:L-alanine-DL-glutamate epimerase-like enolase superfamily enzyme
MISSIGMLTSIPLRFLDVRLFTRKLRLTRPFRFGIVELRDLTHLQLHAKLDLASRPAPGYSGENLAPKWFEKDPAKSPAQDIEHLAATIRFACRLALELPPEPLPRFVRTLRQQLDLALPSTRPLVVQLAASLLERAALDALCRHTATPLHQLFNLAPQPSLHVRHTVGLSDDPAELPSLLAPTGITRLKLKLGGNPDSDLARIAAVAPFANLLTLDGNENYADIAQLRQLLTALRAHPARDRIAWVEQPLHRDTALSDAIAPLLADFPGFPHLLDESDAAEPDLPRALSLGYAGTTHKNCKGVLKSVRAKHLCRLLSGEDLTIISPHDQAQDLAAAAAVGVIDIERNGHHFAPGLSDFPSDSVAEILASHPDLYTPHPAHGAALLIRNGQLSLASVNAAPFGTALLPPTDGTTELPL